jgi:RNA polymerase sigma-B factor
MSHNSRGASSRRPHADLLTDEVAELFELWQRDRDADARDLLVQRFMPLARKLARRYLGANEPFEDLLQVASVGLLLAIDRFDYKRGTAFTSYAVPTILGELRRYFRDLGWAVHVPRGIQERALIVDAKVRELHQKSGRAPTVQQIAQLLEWSLEEVVAALEAGAGHHAASLDAPRESGDAEQASIIDGYGQIDEGYELIEDSLSIAAASRRLPAEERRVLHMRFVEELTQSQIGARVGVSQMQVSRMLKGTLGKLREMTDAQ